MELQSLICGQKLFRSTHKASQEAKAREAVAEVRQKVERLASIWKPVLAPVHFAKFLGSILENLCTSVYAEILSARDISIKETEVLPGLLLVLVGDGLGPFLQRNSPGEPAGILGESGDGVQGLLLRKLAPSWTKLEELVGLFYMSMRDIGEGWERDGGLRAAFTGDEVAHFISLVFEDSPLRASKIDEILRHPA